MKLFFVAMLSCLAAACSGAQATGPPAPDGAPETSLEVERGSLESRLLLTGELAAAEGVVIPVPQVDGWQLQISWLAENGAEVQAGDPLVRFDNSEVSSQLEDKKLALENEETAYFQQRSDAAAAEEERLFQFESRRAELEKARLDAAVPEDLQSAREYQEIQLSLRRAEIAFAKAEEELETQRAAAKADLDKARLSLERARREIRVALEAIDAMEVRAPRDGVVVLAEHPWTGAVLQSGDTIFKGAKVLSLPDLGSMVVEARLSDVDDSRLAEGMDVLLTLEAYPDTPIAGKVTKIAPVATERARQSLRRFFDVVIEPTEVDPQRMRPGMSVKIEAITHRLEDVLTASRQALDLTADPPRARLAGGEWTEVELGPCNAQRCVVEAGLEEGRLLARRESAPVAGGAG